MILTSIHAIYNQSSDILNKEAENFMNAQLDRANENVSLLLKSIVLETEKLSLDQNVNAYFQKTLSQQESDEFLKKLMEKKNEKRPVYMDLFLVNSKGIIVSAAMPEAIGVNVNGRNYFKTAVLKQITNTSDIIFSRADQTQIVITLTPTYNEKKIVTGYTGIALFATYFSDFLENFTFDDKSNYIIVDSFNKIISHPDKKMISKQFNNFGLKRPFSEGYKITSIKGIEHIVMKRTLNFNDWRIISYLETEKIYSKSRELSYTMFRIGIVFMLIAIVMGVYLTNMVSRPIVDITESINRIIEEERSSKNSMINNLPLEYLEKNTKSFDVTPEPTEISNFRSAIQGFKHVLKQGSRNFDIEHEKLKTYIDNMYGELENINSRNLDFISTLSHDIRTPLTLIKGYARGLESGTIKDKDMEYKFKQGIVKSANDIEHLVYNVLDFAYEVGNGSSLNKKTYDLKYAIEQIVFEIKQLYKSEDRKILYDVESPSKILNVHLDLMNITRVLVNLINNSIKYSKENSSIVFCVKPIENGARFQVYDTGMGIDTDELEKITDIFYRTNSAKGKKGYGLGLYVSEQILKGHGFQLNICSKVDSFTQIWFDVLTSPPN